MKNRKQVENGGKAGMWLWAIGAALVFPGLFGQSMMLMHIAFVLIVIGLLMWLFWLLIIDGDL